MYIVLDASVVGKWFLREEKAKEAENLRQQHLKKTLTIAAPVLLIFEIVNLLGTKKDVSQEVTIAHVQAVFKTELNLFLPEESDLGVWVKLMKDFQISGYDAYYILLAKKLGCDFLTADEKLYRKVRKLGCVKLI